MLKKFFKPASDEEYAEQQAKKLAESKIETQTKKEYKRHLLESQPPPPPKRGPGRPKTFYSLGFVAPLKVVDETGKESLATDVKLPNEQEEPLIFLKLDVLPDCSVQVVIDVPRSKATRKKWWDNPLDFDEIVDTVRHCKGYYPAVRELQKKNFAKYKSLNESTIRNWFVKNAEGEYVLQARFYKYSRKYSCPEHLGQKSTLSKYPDVKKKLVALLTALRDSGAPMDSSILRPVMRAVIKYHIPSVMKENGGKFDCSRSWVRKFLWQTMGMSFKKHTTAAQKMPKDWEQQWEYYILRIALLAMQYNIPPELFVNSDQTAVWFVPTNGQRTYEKRGATEVRIMGLDDKRNMTAVPSGAASGHLLAMQLIYGGTTERSLPRPDLLRDARAKGHHITNTANHWSTLKTMKELVEYIIAPYFQEKIKEMKLPADQKCIWSIDCWSVHISEAFRTWLKEHYPWILLVYVPAGMTGKAQYCDVVLQRPFKHGVVQRFNEYVMAETTRQLAAGVDAVDVRVDTSMAIVRDLSLTNMYWSWEDLKERTEMLRKGWDRCKVSQAWNKATQKKALEVQLQTGALFAPGFTYKSTDLTEEENHDSASDAFHDNADASPLVVENACLEGSGEVEEKVVEGEDDEVDGEEEVEGDKDEKEENGKDGKEENGKDEKEEKKENSKQSQPRQTLLTTISTGSSSSTASSSSSSAVTKKTSIPGKKRKPPKARVTAAPAAKKPKSKGGKSQKK